MKLLGVWSGVMRLAPSEFWRTTMSEFSVIYDSWCDYKLAGGTPDAEQAAETRNVQDNLELIYQRNSDKMQQVRVEHRRKNGNSRRNSG